LNQPPAPRLDNQNSYLAYVPDMVRAMAGGRKVPLIFALSPAADAAGMIEEWRGVADKHQWILVASKTYRNGVGFNIQLPEVDAQLEDAERRYPVDPSKVVMTGLSGGAMGSHAYAGSYPARVRAVVANTGMMEESFKVATYPENKLAVFLASPTDFRYGAMKTDRAFLESHHWTTEWIEFEGGHRLASPVVCEQAAAWLADRL
jgi:predicted esterase